MPVLLIVIGAIVAVLGLGSVVYGIPVKEFSFGNTLILAGTVAIVGGLIILAIGAAIGQLKRVAEMLAHEPARPANTFEAPLTAQNAPRPIPFPPRPKAERADIAEPPPSPHGLPQPPFPATDQHPATAPMLRNPDAPASLADQFEVPEHEDVSLSPQQPLPPPAMHRPELPPAFGTESRRPMPPGPPPPLERPARTSYFDTMWPADVRPPKRSLAEEPKPEAKPELPPTSEASSEPVAILKSGVIDGMAYTLYVDGSIEAELPNGTLRFASINELRDHLAKGS